MKVLIVEDEAAVARNLIDILGETEPGAEVMTVLESVSDTLEWLRENPTPDLGLFDIKLADGNSFLIFEKMDIHFPVIFTTAYDSYALQAFEVNSVDYLLKPVGSQALKRALDRYKKYFSGSYAPDIQNIRNAITQLQGTDNKKYKKNILVYIRDRIVPVGVGEIAYFFLDSGSVYCITHAGERYLIDQSLEQISLQCEPEMFFRANRQFMISRKAVRSAAQYFKRKLKVHIEPKPQEDVIISKAKAGEFKKWLER